MQTIRLLVLLLAIPTIVFAEDSVCTISEGLDKGKCVAIVTKYQYAVENYPLPRNDFEYRQFIDLLKKRGSNGWNLNTVFESLKKETGQVFNTFVFSKSFQVCQEPKK